VQLEMGYRSGSSHHLLSWISEGSDGCGAGKVLQWEATVS